jgi:hypothetical protein
MLATASRLLATAGFELTAAPTVTFTEVSLRHGRPTFVADRLWRLTLREAFAEVTLPLGLDWSTPGAVFDRRPPPTRPLPRDRAARRRAC